MTHPVWPLFDLRITTPRLELRYVDDELGTELATLAAKGIHDPAFMPFSLPWTDAPSPELERNAMQWYWRARAAVSATHFHLELAAIIDGVVCGSISVGGDAFPILREGGTGSWLGREFQGRGIGTEIRRGALHLLFAGLDAQRAHTLAFEDNAASLGVTRKLGYRETGEQWKVRRGEPARAIAFEMTRDHWEQHLRTDDITIDGLTDALPLLGL